MKNVTDKRIRLTADIAMTVLLPMLMAYSLIGETFHEVIGTKTLDADMAKEYCALAGRRFFRTKYKELKLDIYIF